MFGLTHLRRRWFPVFFRRRVERNWSGSKENLLVVGHGNMLVARRPRNTGETARRDRTETRAREVCRAFLLPLEEGKGLSRPLEPGVSFILLHSNH